MKIAVCDDEKAQLDYLTELIKKLANKHHLDADVETFVSAEQLLFEYPRENPFHLLILDIMMEKMNGMELAKQIRQQDRRAKILFLSGTKELVFEGYEVGAVRYLLKPLQEHLFEALLVEIFEEFEREKRENPYLIFQYQGETRKIHYDDIWYLEAKGHYLLLATEKENLEWKETFSKMTALLSHKGFYQTHRSYLVNLCFVEKINKTECILTNGMSIPVSRNQYQPFNEAFIDFYKGRSI